MTKPLITRALSRAPEVRLAEAASDAGPIVGYGAVFNERTQIGSYWVEEIAPGAFAAAIAEGADVRALFNHDQDHVLGRTAAGTLTLREDETGLWYEIAPADTQLARDLRANIAAGNITGSSIGFIVRAEEWTKPATPADLPLRRITEVEWLRDVGPVTFPAYEQTTAEAEARSQAEALRVVPAPPDLTLNAIVAEQLDADGWS